MEKRDLAIDNLDFEVTTDSRIQAEYNNCSTKAEAWVIPQDAVGCKPVFDPGSRNLADNIRCRVLKSHWTCDAAGVRDRHA